MKLITSEILEFIEDSPGFYHPITQRIYKKIQSLQDKDMKLTLAYYFLGVEHGKSGKEINYKQIKKQKHERKRRTAKKKI